MRAWGDERLCVEVDTKYRRKMHEMLFAMEIRLVAVFSLSCLSTLCVSLPDMLYAVVFSGSFYEVNTLEKACNRGKLGKGWG